MHGILKRLFFLGAFTVAVATTGALAQSRVGRPAPDPELWAPLGLPRLKTKAQPGRAAAIPAGGYEINALTVTGEKDAADGVRVIERGTTRVLELDSAREWTRPLRQGGGEPWCVSFLLYASDSTVVAVGGAWLGVAASPISGGLQLMIGESVSGTVRWREAGIHVPVRRFGGANMVALPVLTVRLDQKAGTWDLYGGATQLADNIALTKTTGADANHGNFLVRAGKDRAWLCGLVQTGGNPLFDDANGNGIDDDFERVKKGGLLPASLTAAQRAEAAKEWRDLVRAERYEAWLIDAPRPD